MPVIQGEDLVKALRSVFGMIVALLPGRLRKLPEGRDPALVEGVQQLQGERRGQSAGLRQVGPRILIIGVNGWPVLHGGERADAGDGQAHARIRVHMAIGDVVDELPYRPSAGTVGRVELGFAQSTECSGKLGRKASQNSDGLCSFGGREGGRARGLAYGVLQGGRITHAAMIRPPGDFQENNPACIRREMAGCRSDIVVAMKLARAILFTAMAFGSMVVKAGSQQRSQPAAATAADAAPPKGPDSTIHRLILKDGSYQVINKFEIVHAAGGDRIRYISAERGGDWEEVPVTLIDWAATRAYARQHASGASRQDTEESSGQKEAAAIDEEEKADRNRDLEVAPNLRLPNETGVWARDTFHNDPELIELEQNSGNVNQQTGHNITRSALTAQGATKQSISINQRHAKVALHESEPAFYVSLDEEKEREPSADALMVDTHGASSQKGPDSGSAATSRYVIVHADVRKDFRYVGEVKMGPSQLVTETHSQVLEGKRWMKLTPVDPLAAGDYVLMEILSPHEVNLSVWDFRIDPNAPDNQNAILPLQPDKMDR